tara:strand:+ start:312 stop:911 length:600 start_codon:yes stop_codon:yes gene_type:complete
MKTVLRESARLAAKGKVIGATGFFGQALDRALNAIGIQGGDEQATFLKKWRSTDKSIYDANQKRLGVAMATELLREGSKTLSDYDRKRVEELIADLVGTDGVFVSEEVLKSKLGNLERVIDDNIIKTGATLKATETQWGKATTKGGTFLGSILPELRRTTLGATTVGIKGSGTTYNLSDIYDIGTRKFKSGYLTQGAGK